MKKNKISIFGGGSAALTCAFFLSDKFEVSIYEHTKNVGNKFLVAGKGGFNISNNCPHQELKNYYTPRNFLDKCLDIFTPNDTIKWFNQLGFSVYEGSGNKLLVDKNVKPYKVLKKIKTEIQKKNFSIYTNHKIIGFKDNQPVVRHNAKQMILNSDYCIFALGGASWSKTGSKGDWVNAFNSIGVKTQPFQPSNCGIKILWNKEFKESHSGKPLKNIAVRFNDKNCFGEVVVTEDGLEGKPVYDLIPEIRKSIKFGENNITIDLKPNNSIKSLLERMGNRIASSSNYKKYLNLNSQELALLKSISNKETFTDKNRFIKLIKNLRLEVIGLAPLDKAISTVGGIDAAELNGNFTLKKYPHFYTIGEMVNWDAPTGGFLLQGCFSMGYFVAKSLNAKL